MTAAIVFTALGLVGAVEIPDKTMIATVVLSSQHRPLLVWLGAAGGFLVQVVLAVAAGRAIELLPHQALEIVVTALFFIGAAVLLVVPEVRARSAGEKHGALPQAATSWKVVTSAFVVVAIGEFGDLSQILIVNLVGRYHQALSVGVGAFAGLALVSGAGALGGRALLRVLPLEWIRRAGGLALLGFAAYGIYGLAT